MATSETFLTPANNSWVCPANVFTVQVECWGGGGAGAGSAVASSCGGGGGGAYSLKNVSVTPGNTYSLFVGEGGGGDIGNGDNGTDSWFSSSATVMAKGGSGAVGDVGGAGGAAASGVGTTKYSGGAGNNGGFSSPWGGGGGGGAGSTGNGGAGGPQDAHGTGTALSGGDGGNGSPALNNPGENGLAFGGGGGGASSLFESTHEGGSGAQGKVVLTYNLPVSATACFVEVAITTPGTGVILTADACDIEVDIYNAMLKPVFSEKDIYMEIGNVERTDLVPRGCVVNTNIGNLVSTAVVTVFSEDGSYRPTLLDPITIWSPARRISNGSIAATDTVLSGTFTSDDVGKHVIVPNGGQLRRDLKAKITEYLGPTQVRLDTPSQFDLIHNSVLIGMCRFTGFIADFDEKRIGDSTEAREYTLQCQDLGGVSFFPLTVRPEEDLFNRITALIGFDGTAHGIELFWPLFVDNGPTLVAKDYLTDVSLTEALENIADEADVNVRFDTLGRVRVDEEDEPPQALTDADIYVAPGSVVNYSSQGYCNRVYFAYGAGMSGLAAVTNDLEVRRLNGRYVDRREGDSSVTDATTAEERAQTILDAFSDHTLYTFTFTTMIDGFEVGMVVDITSDEAAVSGDHLIHSIKSEYLAAGSLLWRHTMSATNASAKLAATLEYYREVEMQA